MSRKLAYECLKRIILENGYSNLVLKDLPNNLNQKDVSLITQMVYGTLQNYELLSYQWKNKVDKKVKKDIEILLNMSCFQLFFLDRVPHYAVVDEASKLVKPQLQKFIQAILLQCIEEGLKEVKCEDETMKAHIETSIPIWVLNMWKAHYGVDESIKIAKALCSGQHQVIGRINTLMTSKEECIKDEKISFIDDWALIYDGNILESAFFKEGKIIVQDYSSQQVAKVLHPQLNERVLDACSAPGSKTAMIAAMMKNTGEIVACDLHEHRLQLMNKGLNLWGVNNVTLKKQDMCFAHEVFKEESFDKILLDVPCSGLGVIRRKPDLKFRIQPEDIDSLVLVQKKILNSCAGLLKKGGILVYSTCTLNRKENEKQVENFIKENSEYELCEEKSYFPFDRQQDGFYIAKLIKK